MSTESNTDGQYSHGVVDDAGYVRLRQAMGLPIRAGAPIRSLERVRSDIEAPATDELAVLGSAVREGLTGPLDGDLIAEELATLAEGFDRFGEIREIGTPERGQTPYQELTPAAWRLVEHLESANFFESAEDCLPAFTEDHVEATTRQLLWRESLTATLSALGFDDQEQLSLVSNVVDASEELSWWQPTHEYPPVEEPDGYDDGVVYENLPPLHQRAMEGALLWIDGLDWHLWQYEVLITDDILDRGVWDVRTMLAGVYVLGDAARRLAAGDIADDDLAAMVTIGTALAIVGQHHLPQDVAWIDDQRRKPRARAGEGVDQ